MAVISVVNYKGGVGKTTIIANLAVKLANEGARVLLIDLDPQGSLTFSFMKPDEWQNKYSKTCTIKNWFDDRLNKNDGDMNKYIIKDLFINRKCNFKYPIELISSHLELFDISIEMARKIKGGTSRNAEKRTLNCLYMLKKGLQQLEDKYEYIFIDCQPSFDLITQNAIIASDYYLIPTKFDYLSTLGVDSLMNHIEKLVNEVKGKINKYSFKGYEINPKLLGVIGNMVNIFRDNTPTIFNLKVSNRFQEEKYKLFKSTIRNNSDFMDMGELIPAIEKKADNNTKKSIINEIESLTREFTGRVV